MADGSRLRGACPSCLGCYIVSTSDLSASIDNLRCIIKYGSVIAYSFVKSFPNPDGTRPPSAFVRIAIISLGPVAWNAVVLLTFFMISLFMGPMLDSCCAKFGSVMATLAHLLAMFGMVGFFEFLVSISIRKG